MKRRPGFVLAVIAMFLAIAASASAQAVNKKAPEPGNVPVETFTGFAVSVTSGQSGVVEIVINRWSTDGERALLENVLKASGSQAMVNIMQDLPQVGYIKGSETMGDALFYARSTDLPDGTRQVVIATNRPISAAAMLVARRREQVRRDRHRDAVPEGLQEGRGQDRRRGQGLDRPEDRQAQAHQLLGRAGASREHHGQRQVVVRSAVPGSRSPRARGPRARARAYFLGSSFDSIRRSSRSEISIETSRAIRIAGKSWPTRASHSAMLRASVATGVMSP